MAIGESHSEKKEQVERRKNLVGRSGHMMKQRRKRTEDKVKQLKDFWNDKVISKSTCDDMLSSVKF